MFYMLKQKYVQGSMETGRSTQPVCSTKLEWRSEISGKLSQGDFRAEFQKLESVVLLTVVERAFHEEANVKQGRKS